MRRLLDKLVSRRKQMQKTDMPQLDGAGAPCRPSERRQPADVL